MKNIRIRMQGFAALTAMLLASSSYLPHHHHHHQELRQRPHQTDSIILALCPSLLSSP